jgi:hypothetical protein
MLLLSRHKCDAERALLCLCPRFATAITIQIRESAVEPLSGELLPPLANGSMLEICTAHSVDSWLSVPVFQASSLPDGLFGEYLRKVDDHLDYPSNAS